MGGKWYIVFNGKEPIIYDMWYECYNQLWKCHLLNYEHFDTKEEAIARWNSQTGGKKKVEVPPR
ncbi:hypothetical protein Scep_022125 [Stephania cephalantha]|uniref:Ribonuclease H1 N-terminal domain-containing protein n=1 Tax=Stephania cephalantha TaxID=152367 RepID=A0AAP0F5S9_9MAGN